MLIQQLNRTDAEKIQLMVKNVDGSGSITTGMGVVICEAAASADGVSSLKAVVANANKFIGVAAQDIPINGFGLVTAWGYAASVFLSQSVGSWTITSGDTLILGATQSGAFTSVVTAQAVSTMLYRYVIALGTINDTISNPRPYMQGFVRAL